MKYRDSFLIFASEQQDLWSFAGGFFFLFFFSGTWADSNVRGDAVGLTAEILLLNLCLPYFHTGKHAEETDN